MKLAVTRFDYNRRGGMAWLTLRAPQQGSSLDPIPVIEIDMCFAVRAAQSTPANDEQIVVPHPAAPGLHIVAWFPHGDHEPHAGQVTVKWPERATYRFKAVQLVANMVACTELEKFDGAIPRVVP